MGIDMRIPAQKESRESGLLRCSESFDELFESSPEAMSTSAGGNTQSFPPVDDADSEIGMFLRDLRCLSDIA